jgi:nicotinamide-nucleotide amidase
VDKRLYELAVQVGTAFQARALTLATAESCTGGWVGMAVTAVPGSSEWYDRGFITYTNRAKSEMLGVTADTLEKFGAVSEQTVRAMVVGALAHSHARIAVAVSGVAGPSGGTPAKPVGTVCLAWGRSDGDPFAETCHFAGDRDAVREQSVERALEGVLELIEQSS